MSFEFKRAVRENVGLVIALAGGTGSGKTYTAMRLAAGIAGDKPFAVIDTEAGRAKHYADYFNFDHGEIHAPFRPDTYIEAIEAANKAGYPAIVVDSMSHVWAGDGGVLDWQEDEMQRMSGGDWKKREQVKVAAWIQPKMAHKKMVQRLLQLRSHLILCFRAEEKIDIIKDEKGKTKIVPKQSLTGYGGWIPICEKSLPFEATVSFMLIADEPGMPKKIKLQRQHMDIFPLDKPITEESGRRLAQWAAGENPARTVNTKAVIDKFAELGINETEVVKAVGVALDQWTDADLATARRVYADKKSQLTKEKGAADES